jgi:hypothetical protein
MVKHIVVGRCLSKIGKISFTRYPYRAGYLFLMLKRCLEKIQKMQACAQTRLGVSPFFSVISVEICHDY